MSVMFDAVVYLGTISLCHTVRLFRRSQERERRALELESNLNQAKLDLLRMQLNPHFLFNTLNAISTLVHTNPDTADNMIGDLSELLRASLSTQGEQEVPLHRELEFLQRYLDIEQTRFGNRLCIQRDIDPALLNALVPTLILQPLVENAIRHGFEPTLGIGTIHIRAARNDKSLELCVSDNGKGLENNSSLSAHKSEGRGIGLANTRARLEELYGSNQRFGIANCEQGGCIVSLELPFHEAPALSSPQQTIS
jgi:two-component system, LytTR family, sensor kinase